MNMMLNIRQLSTGYGKKPVLFDVDLDVASGEIVAIIGPNGAGKSTVLKAVHGLLPAWGGEIRLEGRLLGSDKPAERVKAGITFCPQGRRVFGDLTVRENLEVGALSLSKSELKSRIEEQVVFFPDLKDRLKTAAGCLSGGEQQMVTLARALLSRPKLLMLDEPSLGLSPTLLKLVFQKIVEINRQTGVTVLMVEQKVRDALAICHRVYGFKLGRVAYVGSPQELLSETGQLKNLFL